MPSAKLYDEDNRTLSDSDIHDRMTYHSPSPKGRDRHGELADIFAKTMEQIDLIVPAGREKSIVFTHLEEAKMMASAGVARNPETV